MTSGRRLFLAVTVLAVIVVAVSRQAPTINPNYSVNYVVEPWPLNMTCTMQNTDKLEWYKGASKASEGQGITSSTKIDYPNGVRTMTVTISKASTSVADSATYRCHANQTLYRTITVQILSVTIVNADYTRSMNATSLSCNLSVDPSKYNLHWEFNDETLVDYDKYIYDGGNNTLVITKPDRTDSGEYFCVYNFTENEQVIRVAATLFAAPVVKKFEKCKHLTQGDPLTLRCEVYGFPISTINWFKDELYVDGMKRIVILNDKTSGKEKVVLKIQAVGFEDTGTYACVAHSDYYNMSSSSTILVNVWREVSLAGTVVAVWQLYLLSVILSLFLLFN